MKVPTGIPFQQKRAPKTFNRNNKTLLLESLLNRVFCRDRMHIQVSVAVECERQFSRFCLIFSIVYAMCTKTSGFRPPTSMFPHNVGADSLNAKVTAKKLSDFCVEH